MVWIKKLSHLINLCPCHCPPGKLTKPKFHQACHSHRGVDLIETLQYCKSLKMKKYTYRAIVCSSARLKCFKHLKAALSHYTDISLLKGDYYIPKSIVTMIPMDYFPFYYKIIFKVYFTSFLEFKPSSARLICLSRVVLTFLGINTYYILSISLFLINW